MGKPSRQKGVRGELEVRDVFRRHGFDVDRVPNSGGLRIKGDLHGLVPVHIEVKRRERLNVPEAYRQAIAEAPEGRTPVVAFRSNHMPWLAAISLDELVQLLAARDRLAELELREWTRNELDAADAGAILS
jgi:Holliday junction resolvase